MPGCSCQLHRLDVEGGDATVEVSRGSGLCRHPAAAGLDRGPAPLVGITSVVRPSASESGKTQVPAPSKAEGSQLLLELDWEVVVACPVDVLFDSSNESSRRRLLTPMIGVDPALYSSTT